MAGVQLKLEGGSQVMAALNRVFPTSVGMKRLYQVLHTSPNHVPRKRVDELIAAKKYSHHEINIKSAACR